MFRIYFHSLLPTSEVSLLQVGGDFPLQLPSIRSAHSSSNVHEGDKASSLILQEQRILIYLDDMLFLDQVGN